MKLEENSKIRVSRIDLNQRNPIPHHATKAKAFCIEALTNLGMCAKNLCLEAIGVQIQLVKELQLQTTR